MKHQPWQPRLAGGLKYVVEIEETSNHSVAAVVTPITPPSRHPSTEVAEGVVRGVMRLSLTDSHSEPV